jgi:hypothetical protein
MRASTFPWLIIYSSLLFVISGVILIYVPEIGDRYVLSRPIDRVFLFSVNFQIVGLLFLLSGLIAFGSLFFYSKRPYLSMVLLLPQQVLLIIALAGAVDAIIENAFLTPSVLAFTTISRLSVVILALVHTFSVWELYGDLSFISFFHRIRIIWKRSSSLLF